MIGPLVSFVIPAYNARATIERAITSALKQDYEPVEVVVVDDGSSDGTADIAAAIPDDRVRLVRLERNGGVGDARNVGISAAGGEYIAWLDADDYAQPTRLSVQIPLMQSDSRIVLVGGTAEWRSTDGVLLSRQVRECRSGTLAWNTWFKTPFTCMTVTVRRQAAVDAGGVPAGMRVAGDYALWMRLSMYGKLAGVSDLVGVMYLQDTGLTATRGSEQATAAARAAIETLGVFLEGEPPDEGAYLMLRSGGSNQDDMESVRDVSSEALALWRALLTRTASRLDDPRDRQDCRTAALEQLLEMLGPSLQASDWRLVSRSLREAGAGPGAGIGVLWKRTRRWLGRTWLGSTKRALQRTAVRD